MPAKKKKKRLGSNKDSLTFTDVERVLAAGEKAAKNLYALDELFRKNLDRVLSIKKQKVLEKRVEELEQENLFLRRIVGAALMETGGVLRFSHDGPQVGFEVHQDDEGVGVWVV